MIEPSTLIGPILLINLGVAIMALSAVAALDLRKRRRGQRTRAAKGALVFLFRDEDLVDATPSARQLIASSSETGTGWQKFVALFADDMPNLAAEMTHLVERGQIDLDSPGGRKFRAVWDDGLARISVLEPDGGEGEGKASRSLTVAARREAQLLRDTLNALPALVWHEDSNGHILWANDAYLVRANLAGGGARDDIWPPERLFQLDAADFGAEGETRRTLIKSHEGEAWFDVHVQPVDDRFVLTATSAERVVAAERERRDFVQTLTKTFGQMNFGLVVFDKHRRLGLFNPALTQMTRLDVEFLAGRPTLAAFLDQLRDRRIIPEPRDYAAWRAEITDAALTAGRGGYEANWLLATGQTYRVCGRVHMDGSFGLTFEDVSKEVSLTRRHRAQIELAQSALDALDDPMAAFSETGALALTNRAFDQMWGIDPSSVLGQMTILDMMRIWQAKTLPPQIWGELRDLIAGHEPRSEWSGAITMLDGIVLSLRIHPANSGATMVIFTQREEPVVNFENHREVRAVSVN